MVQETYSNFNLRLELVHRVLIQIMCNIASTAPCCYRQQCQPYFDHLKYRVSSVNSPYRLYHETLDRFAVLTAHA